MNINRDAKLCERPQAACLGFFLFRVKVSPGNDSSCCRSTAASSLASARCGVKPSGHLFGLCEILIARSPEEQASSDASNRHQNVDLAGHMHDAVLHGRRADAVSDWHAGGLIGQRQHLVSERVIEVQGPYADRVPSSVRLLTGYLQTQYLAGSRPSSLLL
jgi:hypothetical protein